MKKIGWTMTVIAAVSFLFCADAAFAGRVKHRQIRQQKRIHQGVRSGELTRGEACRLERQQAHLQRSKRRAWSDGTLTRRERVRLEIQQDRLSRNIYRAKHNDNQR